MGASDVAFSLELARSSACGLGRELCDAVSEHLVRADGSSTKRLTLTLDQPFAPFLGEVLAQSAGAQRDRRSWRRGGHAGRGCRPGPGGARRPGGANPRRRPGRTSASLPARPSGAASRTTSRRWRRPSRTAGLTLPARPAFTDITGVFDAEGYAGALLDRVAALGRTLDSSGIDQLASALPLLDPVTRPLGSRPLPARVLPARHLGRAGGQPAPHRRPAGHRARQRAHPARPGHDGDRPADRRRGLDPEGRAGAAGRAAGRVAASASACVRSTPSGSSSSTFAPAGSTATRGRAQAFGLCLDQGTLVAGATGGTGVARDDSHRLGLMGDGGTAAGRAGCGRGTRRPRGSGLAAGHGRHHGPRREAAVERGRGPPEPIGPPVAHGRRGRAAQGVRHRAAWCATST